MRSEDDDEHDDEGDDAAQPVGANAPDAAAVDWRAEVCATLATLEREIDDLVVRGLSACGPADLKVLESAAEALGGAGASHVAGRISDVIARQKAGEKLAARALLQLMTSLRVFERVLTLEAVDELLTSVADAGGGGARAPARRAKTEDFEDREGDDGAAGPPTAAAAAASASALTAADEKRLLPVLEDLALAVEDIVASGLVAASSATRAKLDVSFKEASRLKLGRLAASLRYVTEELQRYLDGAEAFSAKRLAIFLARSWVLGRAIAQAIVEKNESALARLLLTQQPVVVDSVRVVTLGVRKRVPQGTGIVAFDFQMSVVEDVVGAGGALILRAGAPLVWSHIVPRKDAAITAEALLHLELKPQELKPIALAEPSVFAFDAVALTVDARGGARMTLGPNTRVRALAPFDGWRDLLPFDARALGERVRNHRASPLDLEVELAAEIVLDDVEIGGIEKNADDTADLIRVACAGLVFEIPLARTEETKELKAALKKIWSARARAKKSGSSKKAQKGAAASSSSSSSPAPVQPQIAEPLFGVLHFDRCRLMFQPLSLIGESGPRHLMLSTEKVDLKALTRSLF